MFPVETCQATLGQWTTHVNSSNLSWVHFDGTNVWCASSGGALKFEPSSERFTKILRDKPGSLVNNEVSCVAVSDGQSVWFGTLGFGLNLLYQGQWRLFTEGFDDLPSDSILSLSSSGALLWAGTTRGLALFQGSLLDATFDVATTGGGIPGNVINDILATVDTAWCATEGGVGRGVRSGGNWTWQALNSGLGNLNVLCVGRFAGRLWAGTQDGIYEYDGTAWARRGGSLSWLPEALQEMGGRLYAAGDSAVFEWQTPVWLEVTPTSLSALFRRLTADHAGKLWCATSEGLVSYDGTDWRQFTPPGPKYNYVEDLSVSKDGRVWATTKTNLAALRFDGLEWKVYDYFTTGGAFQFAWLFSVFASSSGTVWFGHCCCPDCRVDKLDYVGDTEVWSNHPFINSMDITEDGSGIVWFSSDDHGIYAFDPFDSSERNITVSGGKLSSSNVWAVAPIDSRRRWVGLRELGVDLWDDRGTINESDDIWKHFSTEQGLLSLSVRSAVVMGNKAYVGTLQGVTVFQDTLWFRNYRAADLAPVSAVVNDLAVDPIGNVWVATTGGVARIAPSGEVDTTLTYSSSGLVDNEVRCVAVDGTSGEVWFGTPKGMSVFEAWNPSAGKGLADVQVYPNPFRPRSGHQDIRLLGLPSPVTASVYDLTGRLLMHLGTVGNKDRVWDGTDANGNAVPTGVYLLKIETKNASSVKKIAVIR
jgi:ligand-binding sensor domain-containing protein